MNNDNSNTATSLGEKNEQSLSESADKISSRISLSLSTLVLLGILAQYCFILLVNTSSFHNLSLPDRNLMTFLLMIYVIGISIAKLRVELSIVDRMLFVSITLSVLGSLMLVLFDFALYVSYQFFIYIINLLVIISLSQIPHFRFKALLILYSLQVLRMFFEILTFDTLRLYATMGVEIMIFAGIALYIYKLGISFDELFFILIAGIFGYNLGKFLAAKDVPFLIFTSLFQQTLNIGAYSISNVLSPEFFMAIHFAEIFAVLMLFFLVPRSVAATSIFALGVELNYLPLLAFRSLACLHIIQENNLRKSTPTFEDLWTEKVQSSS